MIGGDKLPYDDETASPDADLLETKILLNSTISDAHNVGDKPKSVMEKKIVKRSTNDNTKLNNKIHTKHMYIHKACMKK